MIVILFAALAALAACHHDAPAKPAGPPIAAPEAEWKIVGHVLTPTAEIEERDAAGFNGRSVTVTRTGYATPFQGTCGQASRVRRTRDIEDIVADVGAPSSIVADYNLTNPITAYKMACRDTARPMLEIFVATDHAMTCFSGVCYFLRR